MRSSLLTSFVLFLSYASQLHALSYYIHDSCEVVRSDFFLPGKPSDSIREFFYKSQFIYTRFSRSKTVEPDAYRVLNALFSVPDPEVQGSNEHAAVRNWAYHTATAQQTTDWKLADVRFLCTERHIMETGEDGGLDRAYGFLLPGADYRATCANSEGGYTYTGSMEGFTELNGRVRVGNQILDFSDQARGRSVIVLCDFKDTYATFQSIADAGELHMLGPNVQSTDTRQSTVDFPVTAAMGITVSKLVAHEWQHISQFDLEDVEVVDGDESSAYGWDNCLRLGRQRAVLNADCHALLWSFIVLLDQPFGLALSRRYPRTGYSATLGSGN